MIKRQKFGTGLNMYLRSPNWSKKANIGRINTVPPILKIAKACTLFVANELTNKAETGVKSANNKATGMYAEYVNCVPSTSPDSGGNIINTINEKSDMKNIRYIKKLFLEIGITRKTVNKCSSLSSSIKNAEMKLKIKGIITIKNIKSNGKLASDASGKTSSTLGAIKCITILENKINITGYAKNAKTKNRSRIMFLMSFMASLRI